MGCDGHVESCNEAVLAELGHWAPSTLGSLRRAQELQALPGRAAGLFGCAGPALPQPLGPRPAAPARVTRDERACNPLKRREEEVVACVSFSSARAQEKDISGLDALWGKSCRRRLQVPGATGKRLSAALFIDSRLTERQIAPPGCHSSCLPFHPSLLRCSPLIIAWRWTFSSSCSDVYRKHFLEVCTVSLFSMASLHEETQDLVQTVKSLVGTNMTGSVNTHPASHRGLNSFLL